MQSHVFVVTVFTAPTMFFLLISIVLYFAEKRWRKKEIMSLNNKFQDQILIAGNKKFSTELIAASITLGFLVTMIVPSFLFGDFGYLTKNISETSYKFGIINTITVALCLIMIGMISIKNYLNFFISFIAASDTYVYVRDLWSMIRVEQDSSGIERISFKNVRELLLYRGAIGYQLKVVTNSGRSYKLFSLSNAEDIAKIIDPINLKTMWGRSSLEPSEGG
jgi:hypothetical protein